MSSSRQKCDRTIRITREQPTVPITLATTNARRPGTWVARSAAAAAGMLAVLGIALIAGGPAGATTDTTATIASPGTTTELPSGGSATQFTVALPPQAACSGDTATHGYHVLSYLLPKGEALSSVSFTTGFPSTGFGFFDELGTYYGPVNTSIGTGQITEIPNDFEWAPMIVDGYLPLTGSTGLLYSGSGPTASGVWEAGIVCANSSGVPVNFWNTEVTFSASSSDPNGFTWSATPGGSTTTTTTTTTTTAPTSTTTSTTGPASTTTSTTAPESAGGTTTTTTAPVVAAATTSGDGGSTGTGGDSSSGDPSGSSGSTDGTLAFTGLRTARDIGIGLLAVGLGVMLLSWGHRRRVRAGRGTGR